MDITQLLKSFEPSSRNSKERFNEFLFHCFMSFEKKIKSKKSKKMINRYDIDRKNLINYLIANEKSITLELNK